MIRIATYKRASYQGLPCYIPAIKEVHDSKSRLIVLGGDPLVDRATAIKYAQIEINNLNQKGK